jgi:3,4-dihydroxy 2-butanone 4-phosphate synthase/GTP cyclohydrolase II
MSNTNLGGTPNKISDLDAKIEAALQDIKAGKPIVVVDSYWRENEGDVMIAAECAREDTLAFIAREARGIMCIPTAPYILDRLEIPMSPSNNNDRFSTPFTVSVDARYDVSTGVSVRDRMITIGLILDENTKPDQIAYPGHLFPLKPQPELLRARQGHTEASVQLCLMAQLKPVAIICEIMNTNGSMARVPDLEVFAAKFNCKMISIEEIMIYCHEHGTAYSI